MAVDPEEKTEEKWVTITDAIRLLDMPSATFYWRLKHYKDKITIKRGRQDWRQRYVDINLVQKLIGK